MTAVERIRRFDSADAQWLRKKTWFERARQVLSNLVVFLLPFVRRKGPLFTHLSQRFYHPPSFSSGLRWLDSSSSLTARRD
jgi:hypothetical protein